MTRYRVIALIALVVGVLLAYFVWSTQAVSDSSYKFKLGLDLAGGTELVYKADMSGTAAGQRHDALTALQEVIGRRVNLFGVAEPLVQTEEANAALGTTEDRLIVDLPGVTDINAAIAALGQTPTLDFELATSTKVGTSTGVAFVPTGLTGRYLKSAGVQFASGATQGLASPEVTLQFNDDGAKLFQQITANNIGQTLAIFLDGQPISTPVIKEAIPGGTAVIQGNFTATQARDLARNLNFGALPVPISLESSSSVGPTLGAAAIDAGIWAGIIAFLIVGLFMILWYRFAGVIAVVALAEYLALMLAIIKFIPVTLTASGIAGFIVTLGMAVDANVLIFERTKEELRAGKEPREAVHIGFSRAWTAIRDGHLTMLISGAILFWLGTGVVQGFAFVFVLGVLASLISAVSLSRMFLLALVPEHESNFWKWLLHSGFRRNI